MTDLEKFMAAWPLDWTRHGERTAAVYVGGVYIHATETDYGVFVRNGEGSNLGHERMPSVLVTVKRNLLEEAAELRQRLDAIDDALLLLNLEE